MLFEPEKEDSQIEVLPPSTDLTGVFDVLGACGIAENGEVLETDPESHVQALLKRHGASLEDAARQVGNIVRAGESDAAKLKAAEMILKMHKAPGFDGNDEGSIKAPVFNITIIGSQPKNLLDILVPATVGE